MKISEELIKSLAPLLELTNPKTKQKLRLLIAKRKFCKDIKNLCGKWKQEIKKHSSLEKQIRKRVTKITKILNKLVKNPKDKKNLKELMEIGLLISQQKRIEQKQRLNQDLIRLIKKYRLYPNALWRSVLLDFVFHKRVEGTYSLAHFNPACLKLSKGLMDHIYPDINFGVKLIENEETREPELYIQIYEDTALREVKKHWKLIKKCQESLKRLKGIKKRYYPLKNLSIAEELAGLDKNKEKEYYEPTLDKFIKEKITDLSKALSIYDDIPCDTKEEQKAEKRIRQIRRRYKKILSD